MQKLGIRETPAAVAIAMIALLQYAFIVKIWEGYPLRWSGDAIHPNVVLAGLSVSILGAAVITITSLRRWAKGTAAARRLEKPATNRSFDPIRHSLQELSSRSTLPQPPDLLYTPKNALALEVRQDEAGPGAVVVGLDQRKRQKADPEALAAQLAHELSHLELGTTRGEINARRAVILHFRVLAWLVGVLTVIIGFIDPTGIGSMPPFGGFVPVFAADVYVRLTAQLAILLFSTAIIFVYSYFFVVRREHIHDLRGSQIIGSIVLAERVFEPIAARQGIRHAIYSFFALHPSAAARAHAIRKRDIVLLSAVLFPIIVAGSLPMVLLLTAGWRDVFGVEEHWWNLGITIAAGLVLYLVLSADFSRMGLGALLGKQTWLRVPLYALCAGLATQLPRLLLEIIRGWRQGLPAEEVYERITLSFWAGSGRIALMIALVLLMLAYLSAVRIAALGEGRAGRGVWMDRVMGASIVTGAFAIASLTSVGFIIDVAVFVTLLGLAHLSWFIVTSCCVGCRRRPWGSMWLRTRCQCGIERLSYLRSCVE
jgi:hypothetical protein